MKVIDVPRSGSQANTVASRNRFGQYNRNRATPTQPRTAAQIAVRATLTSNSQAWRDLSDANRAAWNAFAGETPFVDSLGQTIFLTGHQMFIKLNGALVASGQATITVPPVAAVVAAIGASASSTTAAAFRVDAGATVSATAAIIAFASPPQSAGRNFNGDYRVVQLSPPGVIANDPILEQASYVAKYGAVAAGQKVFWKVQAVEPDGNLGAPETGSFVLT